MTLLPIARGPTPGPHRAHIGTRRSSCRRNVRPESDRCGMGCYTIRAYRQGTTCPRADHGIWSGRRPGTTLAVRRRRRDACASLVHVGINSPAEGSGGIGGTYDGETHRSRAVAASAAPLRRRLQRLPKHAGEMRPAWPGMGQRMSVVSQISLGMKNALSYVTTCSLVPAHLSAPSGYGRGSVKRCRDDLSAWWPPEFLPAALSLGLKRPSPESFPFPPP